MVVHMRHTRSHTGNRRSHHALSGKRLSKCAECGAMHIRHRVCQACGKYGNRELINVAAKALKRERKEKEKQNTSPKV